MTMGLEKALNEAKTNLARKMKMENKLARKIEECERGRLYHLRKGNLVTVAHYNSEIDNINLVIKGIKKGLML